MRIINHEIVERVLPHSVKDYALWTAVDKELIRRYQGVTGDLVGARDRFENQAARQHFPEVTHARRLIDEGYPRDFVVYENFCLSAAVHSLQLKKKKLDFGGQGAVIVRGVFSDLFLESFDVLLKCNVPLVGDKRPSRMNVDLFAADKAGARCILVEVKRYRTEGRQRTTEGFPVQQQFVLAAVAHLVSSLGERAFRSIAFAVETGLVSYAPTDWAAEVSPRCFPISFRSPF